MPVRCRRIAARRARSCRGALSACGPGGPRRLGRRAGGRCGGRARACLPPGQTSVSPRGDSAAVVSGASRPRGPRVCVHGRRGGDHRVRRSARRRTPAFRNGHVDLGHGTRERTARCRRRDLPGRFRTAPAAGLRRESPRSAVLGEARLAPDRPYIALAVRAASSPRGIRAAPRVEIQLMIGRISTSSTVLNRRCVPCRRRSRSAGRACSPHPSRPRTRRCRRRSGDGIGHGPRRRP